MVTNFQQLTGEYQNHSTWKHTHKWMRCRGVHKHLHNLHCTNETLRGSIYCYLYLNCGALFVYAHVWIECQKTNFCSQFHVTGEYVSLYPRRTLFPRSCTDTSPTVTNTQHLHIACFALTVLLGPFTLQSRLGLHSAWCGLGAGWCVIYTCDLDQTWIIRYTSSSPQTRHFCHMSRPLLPVPDSRWRAMKCEPCSALLQSWAKHGLLPSWNGQV